MAVDVVHLSKLLKWFALSEAGLVSALRADLRSERDKTQSEGSTGGDFHVAFWGDAKLHAAGTLNLPTQTVIRVEAHAGRKRLYPLLTCGFLKWFDELRRGTNQSIGRLPERVHNHHTIPELSLTVKVDNLLGLKIGSDKHLLAYPYFSETPALSEKWARVGLWMMAEALPKFSVTDMEIVDILRGRSFAGKSLFLKGDEAALLAERYAEVRKLWNELKVEYDL